MRTYVIFVDQKHAHTLAPSSTGVPLYDGACVTRGKAADILNAWRRVRRERGTVVIMRSRRRTVAR